MTDSADEMKKLLSTKEMLAIICFNKHHHKERISCARLSELLKVPINRIKDICLSLEELKVVRVYKAGPDYEVELLENENEKLKGIIDEIIWENKQEYGKIYKKLITAELLDFMGDNKA